MLTFKNLKNEEVLKLENQIQVGKNSVSSLVLAQKNGVGLTLFAFDKGESIGTHSAPGDAMVIVLAGKVEITIGSEKYILSQGESIVMPANIPHSLLALEEFKMLLTVVRIAGESAMTGINNIEKSKIMKLQDSLHYNKGGIVSKRIYQRESATSILFSISAGEEIENNRVNNDTLIFNLEGTLRVNIEETDHILNSEEIILIPADRLYEITGETDSKYQLIEM
ncbi:MAG: cupin domain-containing protein [Fusobacteriaceae bacterium]